MSLPWIQEYYISEQEFKGLIWRPSLSASRNVAMLKSCPKPPSRSALLWVSHTWYIHMNIDHYRVQRRTLKTIWIESVICILSPSPLFLSQLMGLIQQKPTTPNHDGCHNGISDVTRPWRQHEKDLLWGRYLHIEWPVPGWWITIFIAFHPCSSLYQNMLLKFSKLCLEMPDFHDSDFLKEWWMVFDIVYDFGFGLWGVN